MKIQTIKTAPYVEQNERWPTEGRHILAQYDDESIVVYQAYRPSIGRYAIEHQRFGGDFKFTRMSWIKPNFLWMMYRCGWASKEGQGIVLGVRIRREGFESILADAVPSSFNRNCFESQEQWQEAVGQSSVRLQWDPDHDPYGNPVDRRAIQLGLRDEILRQYATEWVMEIIDMTEFVRQQYEAVANRKLDELVTPEEHVYPVTDSSVARAIGLIR